MKIFIHPEFGIKFYATARLCVVELFNILQRYKNKSYVKNFSVINNPLSNVSQYIVNSKIILYIF